MLIPYVIKSMLNREEVNVTLGKQTRENNFGTLSENYYEILCKIIDEEGIIKDIIEKVNTKEHTSQILN